MMSNKFHQWILIGLLIAWSSPSLARKQKASARGELRVGHSSIYNHDNQLRTFSLGIKLSGKVKEQLSIGLGIDSQKSKYGLKIYEKDFQLISVAYLLQTYCKLFDVSLGWKQSFFSQGQSSIASYPEKDYRPIALPLGVKNQLSTTGTKHFAFDFYGFYFQKQIASYMNWGFIFESEHLWGNLRQKYVRFKSTTPNGSYIQGSDANFKRSETFLWHQISLTIMKTI